MKGATKEGSRKRRLQNTSLLKMRRSSKNGVNQQKVATRKQAGKMQPNLSFQNPTFNMMAPIKEKNPANRGRVEAGFPPRQDVVMGFDAFYGGAGRCGCLACRRKSLEICQQRQRAEQIRVANEAWIFRQQQMMRIQPTTGLMASHNKHRDDQPAAKRARMQNFQAASKTAAYNIQQQHVYFQPQPAAARAEVDAKQTRGRYAVNQKSNQLKNVYSRYFPDFHQPHLFDHFSAFQRSHDSLTSSLGSDTSDVVTSKQLGNMIVTSHQLQMINDADFYNFVN